MQAAEPNRLSAGALDALFAPCEAHGALALAVSGGADSLALLILARRWQLSGPGRPPLFVLTVDHGLRPEATAEAAMVAAIAARYGLPCSVLCWEGPHPTSNVEAAAREARYRLLAAEARRLGCGALLTAHHRDDQAETFLLRLARGSGVYGLAAMAPARPLGEGLLLLRPLLDIARADLRAVVAEEGLEPVIDPHNDDPRFDRVRLRRLLPQLAAAGIDAETLAATAGRMARAAAALDAVADRLLDAQGRVDGCGGVRLDAAALAAEPEEIRLRVLARILRAAGGADYVPRLDQVEALDRALAEDAFSRRTAAGVVIERRRGLLRFQREAGREGLPRQAVAGDFHGVWDGRFRVEVQNPAGLGLELGPLGGEGRRALAACVTDGMPLSIEAVPALRHEGRLVAVPNLVAGLLPDTPPVLAGLKAAAVPIVAERLRNPAI